MATPSHDVIYYLRSLPALQGATLAAVRTGVGVTPAASVLVRGAMPAMLFHKLKWACAAVVLLSAVGGGLGMIAFRPRPAQESEPLAAAADDKPMSATPRVDLYGDPLPEGAVMRLGTLQRRAVGAQLAVTADGQSIVSVRGGKYLGIWDAVTGKLREKRQLPGSYGGDSVFSPDGRRLLTGLSAGEKRLKLWDVQTGNLLRTLVIEGASSFWPATFSADGKVIAAAGGAGKEYRLRVWELATGKVVFRKDFHGNVGISRLLFTPDGKRLLAAVSAAPPHLICWELSSGRRLWDVNNFSPYAMVCTPDGKLLSSDKPQARDLATGAIIESEKMPAIEGNSVLRMLLSPNGRMLFVSTFKKVIVWDRIHGKEVRTLAGAGEQIALWPDGKSLLTNNRALQRWDLDSGKPLFADTFTHGHTGEVGHLFWSADGRRLASDSAGMRVNTDGTLRVWDTVTGRPLHLQHERRAIRPVTANIGRDTGDEVVDLSPDGLWLLTNALGEPSLKMWEADTGKEIRTLEFPPPERNEGPRQLFRGRFSSDGARVVALLGSQNHFFIVGETPPTHKVVVWDARTGKRLSYRPIGWTGEFGSAIAPDGRTVVSSGAVMDVASGKEAARLEGIVGNVTPINVAFSRDGALVVGESWRATKPKTPTPLSEVQIVADGVRVWEAASGKTIAHLKSGSWVDQAFFHPNNRFVATNDRDGIQLWDALTGKLALRRQMPERTPVKPRQGVFANNPAFALDGRLATGHPDGTILIWDMPLPARKTKPLTARELHRLWADLADTGAAKAWRAVWRMADGPQEALPFLRGRVKPYPTAAADVTRKLLADLDGDSFEVREAAAKRLTELALHAEPALRAALNAKPSLELRRRIEPLLAALVEMPQPLAPEQLRQLRALIVLESIGTPEARRLLEEAAKGPSSARLTRQARAALACLP